jgi:hypothetical protein
VPKLICTVAVVVLLCGVAGDASARVDLAANARGDQVLLHQVLQQTYRPLFAGLRDAGAERFGGFAPLPPALGIGPRGAVVDDGGGAVVGWGTTDGGYEGAGAVMVAVRRPGGAFAAPVQLDGARPSSLSVAGNARGDALVAWSGPGGALRYAFRPANGTLQAARPVPDAPGASVVGATLDADGTATLAWSRYDPARGIYVLYASTRPPDGDFGAPREISGVTPSYGLAFAAASDGRALLAWPKGRSVMAAERPPGGDFGPPFAAIASAPATAVKGLAIAPSGAAAIAFGQTGVRLTARRAGGAFAPSQRVGSVPYFYSPASVAVDDGGDAAAAWGEPDRGVRAAYRGALEGAWRRFVLTPPQPLFGLPIEMPAAVAVSDAGRATAAWEETDGAQVRTFVRDLGTTAAATRRQANVVPSYVRQGPRASCSPRGARILRRTRTSTVFLDHGEAYGCLLARGAWVWLRDNENYWLQSPARVATAGGLMAYAEDLAGHGVELSTLVVRDLRDPESGVHRDASAASGATGEVAAVELRASGAVAWISCPTPDVPLGITRSCQHRGGDRKQVWVLTTRTRKPRLVDHGRQIDPRSFRLSGDRLTWRHGRALHHARLR